MKRLTKRLPSGAADYAVNMAALTSQGKSAYRQKCVGALAAYEVTGLEPGEIITGEELAEIACALNLLKQYRALGTVEELSALVKARGEAGRTGCPACQKREVIAWDVCNDGIAIESDGALHMLSGGDWEAKINFCPMCGRKLTSAEAEAAMGGGEDG